jgi:hypothetical protein
MFLLLYYSISAYMDMIPQPHVILAVATEMIVGRHIFEVSIYYTRQCNHRSLKKDGP